jgi:hypothetical protein
MKNFNRGSPARNTEMQITIARDGQQMGPYSLEMVNACLAQGMLVPTDMAWYEGAPGWVPLPQVPGASIAGGPGIAAAGGKSKKGLVIGLVAGGVEWIICREKKSPLPSYS